MEQPTLLESTPLKPRRRFVPAIVGISAVVLVFGGNLLYTQLYTNRIYAGVSVFNTPLHGLTREEARTHLEQTFATLLEQGLTVTVGERALDLDLDVVASGDPDLSRPLVQADIEQVVEMAFQQGRSSNPVLRFLEPPLLLLERPSLLVPTTMDSAEFRRRILETFPTYDQEPAPTTFVVNPNEDTWTIAIREGEERTLLDFDHTLAEAQLAFARLDQKTLASPFSLPIMHLKPAVTLEQATEQIPEMEALLALAPFTLEATDNRGRNRTWTIQVEDLEAFIRPTATGLQIDSAAAESFLAPIHETLSVPPQNARFEMGSGRARVFIPSRNGQTLDIQETLSRLEDGLLSHTLEPIQLAVIETEPDVILNEANDLGIQELLGTGVSSYAGSPSNRIKNIRNGVQLLNGILIAPGETFSLIKALEPFTIENGYLPELVIKGDEIIPEIGGGLCQIGSTTFRATMNAGLDVAERRNHSLVVSYYNDLTNGNPGTDATIYSPAPDYKLTNTTEHYILLETVMDETEQKLYFNFWGTSDGRKGWYDAPIVEQWFSAGEPKMIETTSIPVGKTQCQSAHPGANTSFTYHIQQADGNLVSRVFTSHYRSLPKICLVGVEAIPEEPIPEIPQDSEVTATPLE